MRLRRVFQRKTVEIICRIQARVESTENTVDAGTLDDETSSFYLLEEQSLLSGTP